MLEWCGQFYESTHCQQIINKPKFSYIRQVGVRNSVGYKSFKYVLDRLQYFIGHLHEHMQLTTYTCVRSIW